MRPTRSYLVCATPRSGSTLVCQALRRPASPGGPEEYFEALRHSGPSAAARRSTSTGVDDRSILDHLGERGIADEPQPRSPLWSRAAYDRYLEWALEAGTTPNGVFGAKLMWGYFGDFVSLLRNIPEYSELPLAELLPAVFPDLTFVRVVRANKVRQAVSLWKAVQTATWRQEDANGGAGVPGRRRRPPYKSFLEEHRPRLRFHYGAIEHLLSQILAEEARWDAFFEHAGSSRCSSSTRTSPPTTRPRLERARTASSSSCRRATSSSRGCAARPTGSTTTGRAATPTSGSGRSSISSTRRPGGRVTDRGRAGGDRRRTSSTSTPTTPGGTCSPTGYAVPTPNIQLLADQGVLFREAFCAMPTCSGSRACLLTGQGGAGNGMLGLAHRGWR